MSNVDSVHQIYEAFGRGDIPAILVLLAEDVEWEYGSNSTNVPWLQPRRGRGSVEGFFQALGEVEIQRFQPKTFFESGNMVIALIDLEATVRETGRRVTEEDEVHIWTFDSAGKVSRFAHRLDSHQHWLAFSSK